MRTREAKTKNTAPDPPVLGRAPWSWGATAGFSPGERDPQCTLYQVRGPPPLCPHTSSPRPTLCRRRDTLCHGTQVDAETLCWPQLLPSSGPQQVPPAQTEGPPSLFCYLHRPFLTESHTLLRKVPPTPPTQGLTYQPFDYIVQGFAEDSYVSPSTARTVSPFGLRVP